MSGASVICGLPAPLRPSAARLYWDAFGGKLGRVMGPDPLALRYLEAVIRPDHAIVALAQDGTLLGFAGFRSPAGAFAGGSFGQMRAVYGTIGAVWRTALLWLLERDIDNDRLLLDGICVAREARGAGIGTRLMEGVFEEARARGYPSVRLDVIDTNWRARKLYERLGFVAVGTEPMGLARHVFGYTSSTTMVRPVR